MDFVFICIDLYNPSQQAYWLLLSGYQSYVD